MTTSPLSINADLSRRAAVESQSLPWRPSPLPGVHRRMLEREGGEVARVTSIVRYAPGSRFSPHAHPGGEELLVLEGTFSDEHGDFPAGMYLRNPVGSRHAPRTEEGCVLFVKLYWMHPDDDACVRVDTRREDGWAPTDAPGVERMRLHRNAHECAALFRLGPGARLPARDLAGGEELFVVAGRCADDHGHYPEGTWVRNPIGSAPAVTSDAGCRLYVKRGHLLHPPPSPGRDSVSRPLSGGMIASRLPRRSRR